MGCRSSTWKDLCSPCVPDIVHCGRKLKDDLTLDACGIHPGSTLHILKKAWPEPESSPGLWVGCVVDTELLDSNIICCCFFRACK